MAFQVGTHYICVGAPRPCDCNAAVGSAAARSTRARRCNGPLRQALVATVVICEAVHRDRLHSAAPRRRQPPSNSDAPHFRVAVLSRVRALDDLLGVSMAMHALAGQVQPCWRSLPRKQHSRSDSCAATACRRRGRSACAWPGVMSMSSFMTGALATLCLRLGIVATAIRRRSLPRGTTERLRKGRAPRPRYDPVHPLI